MIHLHPQKNRRTYLIAKPPGIVKYFCCITAPREETRKAIRLLVSLFAFDSIPENPTRIDTEYRDKSANYRHCISIFFNLYKKTLAYAENFCKNTSLSRVWYLCRGPPVSMLHHPSTTSKQEERSCSILKATMP